MLSLVVPRRVRSGAWLAPTDGAFDRLFDELWSGFGAPAAGTVETSLRFIPRVDVRETETEYALSAELPGLTDEDFELVVEDGVLTLKGEKRSEHTEEREGYRRVETTSGRFERRFALPEDVDAEAVAARHENGVLTITLPKRPEAQPRTRTIPVSTS